MITYGNDLLDQWYRELLMRCTEALLFRWYGEHNEFSRFMLTEGAQKILLVSRDGERIRFCAQEDEASGRADAAHI